MQSTVSQQCDACGGSGVVYVGGGGERWWCAGLRGWVRAFGSSPRIGLERHGLNSALGRPPFLESALTR